jgi:copper resistance protein B
MNGGLMLKTICIFVGLALMPAASPAAEQSPQAPREHYFPADYQEVQTGPTVGEGIQKYAEDAQQGPQQNFGVQPVHDNQVFATFKADRFEYQWREHSIENLLWDVQGWLGNDYDKLTLKSEGVMRVDTNDAVEEAEVELLYSRNISKFWDLQIGARHDFKPHPVRSFAAIGFQGLAPQWFEIDASAYLSDDGDVSAKIEAEYELMLTQRLVVIPRLEAGLSLQDVLAYDQWQGINDVTLGARLLYQIRREFAPYVGITWTRQLGETANRVEKSGGDIESTGLVAGVRFWF